MCDPDCWKQNSQRGTHSVHYVELTLKTLSAPLSSHSQYDGTFHERFEATQTNMVINTLGRKKELLTLNLTSIMKLISMLVCIIWALDHSLISDPFTGTYVSSLCIFTIH